MCIQTVHGFSMNYFLSNVTYESSNVSSIVNPFIITSGYIFKKGYAKNSSSIKEL